MNSASILVVDDEQGIRSTIHDILTDEGYRVETAADASEARTCYADKAPDLVLLDIWMPDTDGISLLKEWSDDNGLNCPVVVMSGHGTVETAVEATRLGAVDFIEKPLSLAQLLNTVESALALKSAPGPDVIETRLADVRNVELPPGRSEAFRQLRESADEIAAFRAPALLMGEAGSGRDLMALYIHSRSDRAGGPFVAVSGASLADDYAVEQLLGTSSGSEPQRGLFQQAEGGTLFINDLQGMGERAQDLLLGVIEQGVYTRPGRSKPENANIRVLASVKAHGAGGVRADLLAALGVMQLHVPALRDYAEDVPELLRYYVHSCVTLEQLVFRRFSVAAQNRLRNYPWPGNLRELRSLVRRLLLQGETAEVGLQEIDDSLMPPVGEDEPLVKRDILAMPMREAREHFERAYLKQQLDLCGGKVGKLAERVGMERTHLYRKLRALGIDFGQSGSDD